MIKEIENRLLDEKYYEIDHASGLKILVMPKKGYTTAYATFGTKYGSIDTAFKKSGEGKVITVPEGTAHFLEHKLFESEEIDAFERFSKTGANANAFTSFDRTCYLFSCADNFYENLQTLLDFVQSPYFTQQTVKKEQGIIGQEIKMYDDSADWVVLFNMLRAMYHNHPVKIDIAGTVETIAQITDKKLYEAYETFYNLHNMVLCVAGNVEVDKVLQVADRYLKSARKFDIERVYPTEPESVVESYIEQTMPISIPMFCIGYKENYEAAERTLKEKLETMVLTEVIVGGMSPLYQKLIDDGLINSNFGIEYFTGHGYSSVIIQGESKDPTAVKQAIDREVERIRREGIDEEIFNCVVKELYGESIMGYNNISNIAQGLTESYFGGYGMFDDIEIYRNMTAQDVQNRLKCELNPDFSVLSVIKPEA